MGEMERRERLAYLNHVGPCIRVPVIAEKLFFPRPLIPHKAQPRASNHHHDYESYKITRFERQLTTTGRASNDVHRSGYVIPNPHYHDAIFPYVTSYYSRKSIHQGLVESDEVSKSRSLNYDLHFSETQLNMHTVCNNSKHPAKCHECGKVFSCKCILKLHEKSHKVSKRTPHHSLPPSETASSDENSRKNPESSRKDPEASNTVEKKFSCDVCGKKFLWKSLLNRHLIVHTGEKNFRCEKCGKSFSQKSHLKTHELVHIIVRPFPCDKCGKTFPRISSLKIHKQVHSVEKNVHCGKCGKSFSRYANLKSHELIHSGLKPFHCATCGKNFSRKSDLKTHIRTHTGERPFICIICDKRFSRKSILKRHELTHTGEKNFHCDICNKNFTRKSILKRHGLLHINEGSFHCEQCGLTFCRLSKLKEHEETHDTGNLQRNHRFVNEYPVTNYSCETKMHVY